MPAHDEGSDPSVHLVGTGGTIANVTGDYESASDFLPVSDLLDHAPDRVSAGVDVTGTDVTRVGSSSITPEVWFAIAREIQDRASRPDPPDGFVVTHGSNTSEETAYFLNLVLETDRPVVVTAAQTKSIKIGSDAFRNLRDSIRVAADPEAGGRGVMLVVNGEIHHSRDVTKTVAGRNDGWISPNAGRIGDAMGGVEFTHAVERPSTSETPFDVGDVDPEAVPVSDIQVVYASVGADGSLVRATMDDVAGYVVAAFPTGGLPSADGRTLQRDALREAANGGVPVVVCNRGLEGYKAIEPPLLGGGSLRPQKARILLALGLAETTDREELQALFDTY